jgi:hypothetical protein
LAGVTNVPLAPKEWVVYGFRNESWEELDSRKNIVDWSINEIKEFVLDTTHSFSRYKIEVISSVSDSRKSIAEFNFYASSNSGAKLINLPNQSEQTFINHGMDSPININQLNGIKSIESDSTTHESGNKYTHTVDLSKRRVDKIILS